MSTNIESFFADLDGGVFQQQLSAALSNVAAGVSDHNKEGKVKIELSLKRFGNGHQVAIKHKLTYAQPTSRGKLSEENTTETPMYVGKAGALSLFPEGQDQLFTKEGQPATAQEH